VVKKKMNMVLSMKKKMLKLREPVAPVATTVVLTVLASIVSQVAVIMLMPSVQKENFLAGPALPDILATTQGPALAALILGIHHIQETM